MAKRRSKKRTAAGWQQIIPVWTGVFVVLYLLFPGTDGYQGISGDKTWFFYGLSALLLLFGAVLLIRDLQKKQSVPPTAAQIAALVYLACTLISAALSEVPGGKAWYDGTAHEAALTVFCYVLLFLVVSRWGRASEPLFLALFWTMVCFSLICLLQMLGENPLQLYPAGLNFYDGYGVKYSGAYAGTIGNVDSVSAFLALAVPILLLHTRGQKLRKAWPCWLLALFCVGIMVWIQVLCGLVGLVLGGALCLLVLCPDKRRKWVLLLFCLLGAGGLAVLWRFDLPGSLHELHEILHGRFSDSFGTGRFYIWRQMLSRIPDRLWFGVGPDMARYSGLAPFIRPVPKAIQVTAELSGQPVKFWISLIGVRKATLTDAHCYPLQILYCQGLPALLSWLTVVGLSLVHWVRCRRDRTAAILGGGLVCYLCAMLFCFSSVIVMHFFWLSLALLENRCKKQKQSA